MTQKDKALDAISVLLTLTERMEPSFTKTLVMAALEEAQGQMALVEEKVDKRKHRKTRGPQHGRREMAILGGEPSL